MTSPAPELPDLSPLDMANNLTRSALAYSIAAEQDAITAHVNQYGAKQAAAAELAGHFALVSIAQNLQRIADHLTGG